MRGEGNEVGMMKGEEDEGEKDEGRGKGGNDDAEGRMTMKKEGNEGR
jgi:hypothetical protein